MSANTESTFSTDEHDMNESSIITSVRFNKKPWTEDEDNKLLRFLDGNGSKWKWSKISSILNINRTGKQCRERYKNHLSPKIKKGDWTPEEDKIIMEMKKKLGNHWTTIANFLPGRSDNAVKNRCRLIERNPRKKKRSHSTMMPQAIKISDNFEKLDDGIAYSHANHEHCQEIAWIYYYPVSNTKVPMDLHQHCDHDVEEVIENDVLVNKEELSVPQGIDVLEKTEAEKGWFEDGWVDDIIQIAQSDILSKASDANMVTPACVPLLTMDRSCHLFQSMFSRTNINYTYPTLVLSEMPFCTMKANPRIRTFS